MACGLDPTFCALWPAATRTRDDGLLAGIARMAPGSMPEAPSAGLADADSLLAPLHHVPTEAPWITFSAQGGTHRLPWPIGSQDAPPHPSIGPHHCPTVALLAARPSFGGPVPTSELIRPRQITIRKPYAPPAILLLVALLGWGCVAAFGLVTVRHLTHWRRSGTVSSADGGISRFSTLAADRGYRTTMAGDSTATHGNSDSVAPPELPASNSHPPTRGRDSSGRSPAPGNNVTTMRDGMAGRSGNTPAAGEVKIMYWNIFHDFALKLTSRKFHALLRAYDIMFFAETDMRPGEEDSLDIPSGYSIISLPRKFRLRF
ncbi:hypothetical protein C8R46DRAFT_1210163 [Mycena filopes]|nr:hypothetical protein C8R46DRAFT_1210163 [Mycena filopes]